MKLFSECWWNLYIDMIFHIAFHQKAKWEGCLRNCEVGIWRTKETKRRQRNRTFIELSFGLNGVVLAIKLSQLARRNNIIKCLFLPRLFPFPCQKFTISVIWHHGHIFTVAHSLCGKFEWKSFVWEIVYTPKVNHPHYFHPSSPTPHIYLVILLLYLWFSTSSA